MLPALFEHGWPVVQEMTARVQTSIYDAIWRLEHIPSLDVRPPDGGYYLFPRLRRVADDEELVLHLLRHGVLVHPGYFYSYERGAHLMLSCLTEPAQLREGLERLAVGLEAF
ncbi:MAG: hypothetical protein H7Y32_05885 [Chloroflexales bacterium]|nr:hypothetical protein [Chloroflexales bacterium]